MEVHLCMFDIFLNEVKFISHTPPQQIQAVWRSEKGQIIIVGAMRPIIKKSVATFKEVFEIKTDLLRDPQTRLYHSNTIILQIRKANQPMQSKISGSICRFNLADSINGGALPEKSYVAQDESFSAVISMKCSQIEDTGMKKALRKYSYKRQHNDTLINNEEKNPTKDQMKVSRTSRKKSGQQKQRSSSREQPSASRFKEISNLERKIAELNSKLQTQQTEHLLTEQKLKQAEMIGAQHQLLINQLSALVSQRQTCVVELTKKLEDSTLEKKELHMKNQELSEKIVQLQKQQQRLQNSQERINELEKALKSCQESYHFLIKSQNQRQKMVEELEEVKSTLQKELKSITYELKAKEAERGHLLQYIKTLELQKGQTQRHILQYKSQFNMEQALKREEFLFLKQEYQTIFENYKILKEKIQLQGQMVPEKQLKNLQLFYEEKIAQHLEKQTVLKEQMEIIQQQMENMEEILEQKEQNEHILIDHATKLQNDLNTANYDSNWWVKVLSKEIESPGVYGLNGGRHQVSEQLLKERIKQLLKILQKGSKQILQSERNKRQITRLQKIQQELLTRYNQTCEQLKMIKQRLNIMLKENKKLLEKNSKINRQFEALSKINSKLNRELDLAKQKQQQMKNNENIFSNRCYLYEKQLKEAKETLEKIQNKQSLQSQTTDFWKRNSKQVVLPMPAIRQTNQQLVFSIPLTKNSCSTEARFTESQVITILQEISNIIDKRKTMHEQLLTSLSQKICQEDKKDSIRENIQQLQIVAAQVKTILIRAGQKQAVKNWQSSIRRLNNLVSKVVK